MIPLIQIFAVVFQEIPSNTLGLFIFLLVVMLGIAVFFSNFGDRTQLLAKKWVLINMLTGFFFSSLYLSIVFWIRPDQFLDLLMRYAGIAIVINFITSSISRFLSYKSLIIGEIQEKKPLKTGIPVLKVDDLHIQYPIYGGLIKKQVGAVKAVNGVSFEIKSGETIGLVGESGCGKSTIARTILGVTAKKSGEISFKGTKIGNHYPRTFRQKIQMVFQDPDASLNPRMKVVDIISEPLRNLLGITDKKILRNRVLELMEQVSLKKEHLDRFAHEFSGGQKQRIIIARALACNPELIILDEPTSALDVSVQAQILNLLKNLQDRYGYAFLFITHNLSVVHHIADKVAVMYLGKFVEFGSVDQIFSHPSHPYTQALLSARSDFDREELTDRIILEGEVPSPINIPSGCAFAPRCHSKNKTAACSEGIPHKIEIEPDHVIWCLNYSE